LHTNKSPNPIISDFGPPNMELTFYNQNIFGEFLNFSSAMRQDPPSLYHGHGIWQLPVHQMAQIAKKQGIPYIISPHGMLNPGALNQNYYKKRLALRLFQSRDLKEAVCLHATAELEANYIRDLGIKNPIAVIPNGIGLNSMPIKSGNPRTGSRNLLFLSRLHPYKGIENLIEAWSVLPNKLVANWTLKIIGNGEESYVQKLRKLVITRKMDNSIMVLEPLYGQDKIRAYHEADLFVLPTYSENFGMVIAESLACGTPVITTKGAPWKDLESHKCGWWTDIGVEPLVEALTLALTLSPENLQQMGLRGRELIEKKYSVTMVARHFQALYNWILNCTEKPDFVHI